MSGYMPASVILILFSFFMLNLNGLVVFRFFFRKFSKELLEKKRFFLYYCNIIASGFIFNTIVGYFIYIIWPNNVHIYYFIIGAVYLIEIIYEIYLKKNDLPYFKRIAKQIVSFISLIPQKIKKRQKTSSVNLFWIGLMILFMVLSIFLFGSHAFTYYTLPLIDTRDTMAVVQKALVYNKFDFSGIAGYYPLGFYFNLIFFNIFTPNTIYWYMKYFCIFISLFNVLLIYEIMRRITKNKWFPFIGFLIYFSANSIIGTAIYTYANNFGLMMSFILVLNFVQDQYNHNTIFLGLGLSCSLLIHPICGGFLIPSMLIYAWFDSKKKTEKRKKVYLVLVIFIICITAYLLFFGNSLLHSIMNQFNITSTQGTSPTNGKSSKIIQFDWSAINFSSSNRIILNDGISSYFLPWIFLYIFAIVKYRKYLSFTLLMGLEIILYFYLPITINGTWIGDYFSFYYPNFRFPFVVNILWIFSVIMGLEAVYSGLRSLIKKLAEKKSRLRHMYSYFMEKNLKEATILFLLICVISVSFLPTYISKQNFTTSHKVSNIPVGYEECLLWTNYNIGNNASVLISSLSYVPTAPTLQTYFTAVAPSLHITPISPSNMNNSNIFFSYEYVILSYYNFNLINQSIMDGKAEFIYNSTLTTGPFSVIKIL